MINSRFGMARGFCSVSILFPEPWGGCGGPSGSGWVLRREPVNSSPLPRPVGADLSALIGLPHSKQNFDPTGTGFFRMQVALL